MGGNLDFNPVAVYTMTPVRYLAIFRRVGIIVGINVHNMSQCFDFELEWTVSDFETYKATSRTTYPIQLSTRFLRFCIFQNPKENENKNKQKKKKNKTKKNISNSLNDDDTISCRKKNQKNWGDYVGLKKRKPPAPVMMTTRYKDDPTDSYRSNFVDENFNVKEEIRKTKIEFAPIG